MEIVDLRNRNIHFITQSLINGEIGCFVRYLYLNNNSIRALPDELFICCTNLVWLDLRCNQVRRLPDGIKGHQHLQVLLLGKNDLKQLPLTLGSLPKLRELQVVGNPLDYPVSDIVKKGSKYLIGFLREKWKNEQGNSGSEIITFNSEAKTVKKIDSKVLQKDKIKKKKTMDTSKIKLMDRYSWPMIFLTNWSSDRLVSDRDIRIKELERLYLEKQKVILERQERILQSFKNKETLKLWRNKAKQLQLLASSHKLKNYEGLEIPFGVNKEFSKMISRQTYRKEIMENINYKNTVKPASVKPFDFDLEMSEIYKMLTNLTTSSNTENKNKDKVHVSETSNIDNEVQKLYNIQRRIAQLKTRMV